jgi:hypothetical protein
MKRLRSILIAKLRYARRQRFLASERAKLSDPSQIGEGKILEFMLSEFQQKGINFSGTFLELGGNSAYDLSTSWYLEKKLGYRGITVEPMPSFADEYKKFRKKTTLLQKAVVPSHSKEQAIPFYCCNASVLSTLDHAEADRYKKMGYTFDQVIVETVCLDLLMGLLGVRIDIIILDIESSDLQLALLADLKAKTPQAEMPFIICIETLDYSCQSRNLRNTYDSVLSDQYQFMAGSYLNSIYVHNSIACELL